MSSKNQREKVEISRNIELVRELEAAPKPTPVPKPTIQRPLETISNGMEEAYLEALAKKDESR